MGVMMDGRRGGVRLHGGSIALIVTVGVALLAGESWGMPVSHGYDGAELPRKVGDSGVEVVISVDGGSASNTTAPLPLLPVLEPFVMCSMSLIGPPFENLTTSAAHNLFKKVALDTLLFYSKLGVDWQHRIDVIGWCRLKGSECKLGPLYAPQDVVRRLHRLPETSTGSARRRSAGFESSAGDGLRSAEVGEVSVQAWGAGVSFKDWGVGTTRRARELTNGATVHFRVVGPNVTSDTIRKLNGTKYLVRTRAGMAPLLVIDDSQWAATLRFCPAKNASSPECNVTKLVNDLTDDWFHLDLTINWSDFPTFDQVTDSFISLTTFGAIVTAGVIVWISIRCQQRRLKRLNGNKAAQITRPKPFQGKRSMADVERARQEMQEDLALQFDN